MPTTHDPIFVLASGQRCGSTLVQRYLSTHPHILIWGEHDGILRRVFESFDRLYEWNSLFGHHLDTFLQHGPNNFIANMNPSHEVMKQAQIAFMERLWAQPVWELGRPTWGFKEVLYTADIALNLRDLYPKARVIYITRHVFKTFTSLLHEERLKPAETYVPLKEIWTRQRTIESLNYWVDINRSFLDSPGLDESWVFRLRYEDLVTDVVGMTKRLVEWLDLDYDEFDLDVFHHKIYTDRHNGPDKRPKIDWKDLNAEEFALLTQDKVLEVCEELGYDMPVPPRNIVQVSANTPGN